MKDKTVYTGLDGFRLIAALLVVAIHTSPLAVVNGTADFMLTRIVARVAVPFFFMASGFFLFSQGADAKRLYVFLRKTAVLYAIAMLLYLPLNLYNVSALRWASLPDLLRSVFVDGTFYHLWYLPAAMLGAAIAWALLRSVKQKGALIISLILYAIGLFGDSYYGFADKIPALKAFYQTVFAFFGHTRNGLFFAPIFFVLGARITKSSRCPDRRSALTGLGLSLALMAAEGLLLRGAGVQRRDSMYVMLLPCMIFLFQSLLVWKGRAAERLRSLSAAVYILHPMMIVCVLGISDLTRLRWLLVDNSLIFFMAVAACSLAAAVLLGTWQRKRKEERKAPLRQGRMDRAWAEIDLENLCHNARVLQQLLPGECAIMAVVKANAYGHGDIEVSKALNRIGIRAFAIATADEGIHLRKNGIQGEILILGYTDPHRALELAKYRLSQAIVDAQYASELSNAGKTVQVHIKVDTGMHRLGESHDHAREIAQIFRYGHLQVNGIFTHLCSSDSMETDDVNFTKLQIRKFDALLEELKRGGIPVPKFHIQSSYGVLNYPEARCGYARVGIALYGASGKARQNADLRPVLSLRAKVILVRTIAAGESVGYGRQFVAGRDTHVAVLPVGYSDGVPRDLGSKQGCVLLHGCRAPIVGRICMDQMMVDVTGIPDVKRGDTVTLIGRDGTDEISVEEIAANTGTIPNELLSRLGSRLERVFLR